MKILIKVTKEILEKSKMCGRNSKYDLIGANCAIALAIREIFPSAHICISYIDPFYYYYDNLRRTPLSIECNRFNHIKLPLEASKFIYKFDRSTPKGRVKLDELSFEIDIPQSIIDKIGISEAKEIINKSQTLELVEV